MLHPFGKDVWGDPQLALDLGHRFISRFVQLDGFQLEFAGVGSLFGCHFGLSNSSVPCFFFVPTFLGESQYAARDQSAGTAPANLPAELSGFSQDTAQNKQDNAQFLLELAEQEAIHRKENRIRGCIRNAHFPVQKEVADFEFSALPKLNKAKVLDLARGDYIDQQESIILVRARPTWQPGWDWLAVTRDTGCASTPPPAWSTR